MEQQDESAALETDTIHNAKFYPDFSRKFVCIQYPGKVENVDKMIQTLGGIDNIETVVGSANKKLELRFHPDNFYSKPCYADRNYKPGVLLKVKVRQPKGDADSQNEQKGSVVDYEVAGVTAMGFKFNRLCDFQYLPLVSKDSSDEKRDTELEYIYDKIVPDKLPDSTWLLSEESANMAHFHPPQTFSRFDGAQNKLHFDKSEIYESTFRPEFGERIQAMAEERKKKKGQSVQMHDLPFRTRRKPRKVASVFVNFDDAQVPMEAPTKAAELLTSNVIQSSEVKTIEQLFEERPIWSKAGLCYVSRIDPGHLKHILPSFAYFCNTGPWRIMWIKYGYDPRKDPSARIYQTFDFRVRFAAGSKIKVQAKRTSTRDALVQDRKKFTLKGNLKEKQPKEQLSDSTYLLRPGMIPSARQMFYQYCDIYLPEIKTMLARLPEVQPGARCDPKNGWLPDKFHDQCREIATKYISEEVQRQLLEDKINMTQKATEKDADSDDDVEIIEEDEEEELEDRENLQKTVQADELLDDDDDSENDDQVSVDDNIDMDAVEEINKIIAETKTQDFAEDDVAGPSRSFSNLTLR